MRTFIAVKIKLNHELKDAINVLQRDLREANIKWIDFDNMHLTFKFLGEISDENLPEIMASLEEAVSDVKNFEFLLNGIGVFPTIDNPRILWIGIDKSRDLENFNEKIQLALKLIGIRDEMRVFTPHLTIGRIRSLNDLKITKEELNRKFGDRKQIIRCTELRLYESMLTKKGSVYNILKSFKLK